MKPRALCLVLLVLILAAPAPSLAHSGRTDKNGGHHVTATGEYHYHNPGKISADIEPEEPEESDFPISALSPKPHILALQSLLTDTGDYDGELDGVLGKATASALEAAASRYGAEASGECGYELYLSLVAEASYDG